MIHLLDTDLLIFLIRGLKTPRHRNSEKAASLLARCRKEQLGGSSVGLSAITVSELEFGARNSANYKDEIAAVRKILMPFDLYDYDAVSCSEHYGRIRHELESTGQGIGSMDTLIAAHAMALGGTLVTNNETHFSRVTDLKIVNWLKEER